MLLLSVVCFIFEMVLAEISPVAGLKLMEILLLLLLLPSAGHAEPALHICFFCLFYLSCSPSKYFAMPPALGLFRQG